MAFGAVYLDEKWCLKEIPGRKTLHKPNLTNGRMLKQIECKITDASAGTLCEGARSDRCSVEVQRRPCQYKATDPKLDDNKPRKKINASGRGKNKSKWTKEERKILWECYIRSRIISPDGYIKSVMEMWNGRDVSVRSQASVLSQIKCIRLKGLLTQFEKREIETKVEMQIAKCHEPKENEGVDFNISSDNNSASENFNDDDVCSSPILHETYKPLKQELSLKPKLELRRLDNVKEEEEIRTLTESEKENDETNTRDILWRSKS